MSNQSTIRIKLLNYLHHCPLVAVHEIPYKEMGHAQPAVARELRWMAGAGLVIGTVRPRDLFVNPKSKYKEWRLTEAGEQAWDGARKNIIITP